MLIGAARRGARVGRGELPLRQGRARARRSSSPARASSRRASCRSSRPTGETVSSSHIRGLVAAGEVAHGGASSSAGRSCSRARSCTATSAAASSACRPRTSCPTTPRLPRPRRLRGVAPGRTAIPAAVNVGVRPTFETGRGLLVEAYLIDFDGDLYGETLRIAFVERLRGEKRFDVGRGAGRADAASSDADRRRARSALAASRDR